jgi:hypothetical protein
MAGSTPGSTSNRTTSILRNAPARSPAASCNRVPDRLDLPDEERVGDEPHRPSGQHGEGARAGQHQGTASRGDEAARAGHALVEQHRLLRQRGQEVARRVVGQHVHGHVVALGRDRVVRCHPRVGVCGTGGQRHGGQQPGEREASCRRPGHPPSLRPPAS